MTREPGRYGQFVAIGIAVAVVLLATFLTRNWEIGVTRPTRDEIVKQANDHDQSDNRRFQFIEGRIDTVERIQGERREQIINVERQVAALDRIVAGHEIMIRESREQAREFRNEFKARMDSIELMLRVHTQANALNGKPPLTKMPDR